MSKIIEDILKLPKKKKIELYYALQEDLDLDDAYLSENELTPQQWKELKRRSEAIKKGELKTLSREEFNQLLQERRNALSTQKS